MSVSEWTRLAGERKRARARFLFQEITQASASRRGVPRRIAPQSSLPREEAWLRGEIVEAGSPGPGHSGGQRPSPGGRMETRPLRFVLRPGSRVAMSLRVTDPAGGRTEARPRTLLVPKKSRRPAPPGAASSQDRAAIESTAACRAGTRWPTWGNRRGRVSVPGHLRGERPSTGGRVRRPARYALPWTQGLGWPEPACRQARGYTLFPHDRHGGFRAGDPSPLPQPKPPGDR